MPHFQSLDQVTADEIFGRGLRQSAVETQAQHDVHAAVAQRKETRGGGGQARRRRGIGPGARKKFLRMRVESHNHGRQVALLGARGEVAQYAPVADMHRIEVADGERAAAGRQGG